MSLFLLSLFFFFYCDWLTPVNCCSHACKECESRFKFTIVEITNLFKLVSGTICKHRPNHHVERIYRAVHTGCPLNMSWSFSHVCLKQHFLFSDTHTHGVDLIWEKKHPPQASSTGRSFTCILNAGTCTNVKGERTRESMLQ